MNYINIYFPIERVAAIEKDLAVRMKDLLIAQQTTTDEIHYNSEDDNDSSIVIDYKYQIDNSSLPNNGDYQIDNILRIDNGDLTKIEVDSPQLSLCHNLHEVLSALSHACQLINVIAFYLHINLPFRLHHFEFNKDYLTEKYFHAIVAKLNTNIISGCLSQDIPIDFTTNVTQTLENLLKLLTLEKYLNRPKPVIYSQEYIDILEKKFNELDGDFVIDYWFNNDEDEENVWDILDDREWEAIPEDEQISNDPFSTEQIDTLVPVTTSQHSSSMMSSSIDYLKNKFGFH